MRHFCLSIILIAVFLISCNKEDKIELDDEYVNVPQIYKEVHSSGFQYEFRHMSSGNILKQIYTHGTSSEISNYYYNDTTIKIIRKREDGQTLDTTLLTLNSRGLAEKSYQRLASGLILLATNEYDTNGYLTKQVIKSGIDINALNIFYIYEHEIVNDNIIRTTRTEASGYKYYTTYTYFTDKFSTIGNYNKGMKFYGKSNRNLINMEVSADTMTYSYHYDARNNITKVDITVENVAPYWIEYTYR